jgi:hypothetical protein
VEFPIGSCSPLGAFEEPLNVWDGLNPFTGTSCKAKGGNCCSPESDGHYYSDNPPFSTSNAKVRDIATCYYCWKSAFKPQLNLQAAPTPPSGYMVCAHQKPADMTNHVVLYHKVGDELKEKYCTTPAPAAATPTATPKAALTNHHSKCSNPVMPNLPGMGYNILTGMPLPVAQNDLDPGFLNNPVFDPTFDDCRSTDNHKNTGYWEWTVPDVYTLNQLNAISDGKTSQSMHDEHTFQKQAASSLTVSGSGNAFGVGMEFTAGAQWESSTSGLSEGEMVEQRFYREASAYKTTVAPYDVDLSDSYLKALTGAYVSNKWSLFFASYGTHVVTEVISGARYTQVSHFSRSKFEEITSNMASYQAGIKASYGTATGDVNGKTSNSNADQDMVESSADDQYFVSTGGNGEQLDDKDRQKYLVSAHNYPAPLSLTLMPHDTMVTLSQWSAFKKALALYHPDEAAAKDVTTDKFEKKFLTAIQVYCGDEAHKCQAATSIDAPTPMKLTTMHFDSEKFGRDDGIFGGKSIVSFGEPDFKDFKALIKISAIRTYCDNKGGMQRLRGIQFEYFDGNRSPVTDILGVRGDSDPASKGKPWDDKDNKIAYGEIISAVEISAGTDVDGIWFVVQNPKSSTTRRIGCGYMGKNPTIKSWNIKPGYKLLGLSGSAVNMDGNILVKEIQLRSFLFILPTIMPNGAECTCVTPNQGTVNLNGAKCTNGDFLWCGENEYCTKEASFPIKKFRDQCIKINAPSFQAQPKPSVQQRHQAMFLQIKAHEEAKQAQKPETVERATFFSDEKPEHKDSEKPEKAFFKSASTRHHSKWEEAKDSVKHAVREMSKNLKDDLKTELKKVLSNELKDILGNLQEKQGQLERTVTRMLLHQVENY